MSKEKAGKKVAKPASKLRRGRKSSLDEKKLTVIQTRVAKGHTQAKIAKALRVSQPTISRIVRLNGWRSAAKNVA